MKYSINELFPPFAVFIILTSPIYLILLMCICGPYSYFYINIPLCIILSYFYCYLKYQIFYKYIISRVYIKNNKIGYEKYIRYNNIKKRFEFFGNDSWHTNLDIAYINESSYKNIINGIFKIQEYDNKLFINKDIVDQYMSFKEECEKNKNQILNIHKFTKFDRLSNRLEKNNI